MLALVLALAGANPAGAKVTVTRVAVPDPAPSDPFPSTFFTANVIGRVITATDSVSSLPGGASAVLKVTLQASGTTTQGLQLCVISDVDRYCTVRRATQTATQTTSTFVLVDTAMLFNNHGVLYVRNLDSSPVPFVVEIE